MRHKKKKQQKIVVTDDEDDIPLTLIKSNSNTNYNGNSYDSLCVPSRHPCELCDRVSENRYSSLIHNAKHIIIPLLNHTVHQCDICLYHFISIEDLVNHQTKKHTLAELITQTDLVSKNFNNPEDEEYTSDLISIIKKEAVTPVKILPPTETKESHSSIKKTSPESKNVNNGGFSLKSRLVFEDDIISLNCDQLLTDLTTDCQVKVEIFPPIWQIETARSVHYNELIKPGVFRCKKCGKTFPSRYETIIHESNHIFIKDSEIRLCKICNQYILGDRISLLDHKLATHWNTDNEAKSAPKEKNHGGNISQNGVAEPYVVKTTAFKLCDMCFTFSKNRHLQNYNCIGELSEAGKRYKCEKCGFKFFDVKLVERTTKYKFSSYQRRHTHKNNQKCLTNEARLKVIRKRLKLMRKTYFVVLFID